MNKLSAEAFAKINLYLDVCGRLDNGYHALQTVMQTVSLSDIVTVEKTAGGGIESVCIGADLSPADNLAVRAARRFYDRFGIAEPNLKITLEKHIPVSAGLGGGSADAAAVLVLLNRMYGTGLGEDELCAIGAGLGADIPFCIRGGICRCSGIGTVFHPCAPLPSCVIVVASGRESSQTGPAYAALDECGYTGRGIAAADAFCDALASGNLQRIGAGLYNAFEATVLARCPEAARIRRSLADHGALGALMSGSGPSVFGLFSDREAAGQAVDALIADGHRAFVCLPQKL